MRTRIPQIMMCLFLVFTLTSCGGGSGTNDSASNETAADTVKMTPEQYREQLAKEIKSLEDGFDGSNYRNDITSMQIEIALFNVWAKMINEGLASDDKERVALAKKLKVKVAALQKKEFPALRKAYAKVVKNKLWEENIEVNLSGKTKSILSFTGGAFANNKNIKATQETLYDVLKMFRFKQTQFKWYSGADEYTYYDVESPKDDEIAEL